MPENTPNTPAVRSTIVVPKDAMFRDGVVVEFPNGFGFSYTFRRIGRPTAQRMAHLFELAKSGDSKNMIVFKPWIARLSPYDPSKPENGATTLSGTSAEGYDIEMFMSTKGNVLVDPKEQRRIIAFVLSSIKDVDQ